MLINKLKNKYFSFVQSRMESQFLSQADQSAYVGECLVYHHVTTEEVDAPRTCKCTPEEFKSSLLSYQHRGYEFVSASRAMEIIDGCESRKFTIVTFDDVPNSVYHNAYPILKELCIPFVLFIATDLVDTPGYLSSQKIIEFSQEPLCTIGGHSMHHKRFRKNKSLEDEIIKSKQILESLVHGEVRFFAYPYGSVYAVDKKAIKIVQANYECAFSTIYGELTQYSTKDRWFMPRTYLNR